MLLTADNLVFMISISSESGLKATPLFESNDELDPILFVNKFTFEGKAIAIFSTLHSNIYAFNLTDSLLIGQIRSNSAVSCLGSLRCSSGFNCGITLLQIGNMTTPALSDSKCRLFAISLPILLR